MAEGGATSDVEEFSSDSEDQFVSAVSSNDMEEELDDAVPRTNTSREETVVLNRLNDLPLEAADRQRLEASKELNILIVGCYHVGKSALINALFFREDEGYKLRAREGSLSSCTKDVTKYTYLMEDVTLNIYDSPGLQDESGDFQYIKMIKEKCPNIHLIIYCKKMKEPMRPEEKAALKNLNRAFGSCIWDITIFALTFGNCVHPPDPDTDEEKYFKEIKMRNIKFFEEAFKEFTIKKNSLKI